MWQSPYEEVESYTWHAGTKEIESLCSTCHLLPTPNVEPKSLWPDKIEQMYGYMRGPRPIPPDRMPPIERVIDYWASQFAGEAERAGRCRRIASIAGALQRHFIQLDPIPAVPAIANVKFVRLGHALPRNCSSPTCDGAW